MTVPNVVSVTTPTSAPSNRDLTVNLPTGDPTGKLLLAVVHDYAIGGPNPPNDDWLTVVRGDAVSVFSKIGELADSGGTITFRAFSQEVVTPDNTGYVIEVNNASGVEVVSALAKGTGDFAYAPGVTTHYNDELQIDLIVADRKSGTPTYPFLAYTQIVEHQPSGGCEVFAATRTQTSPGRAPGTDVDFNVSTRWRARTIAVVGNRPPHASTNLNPGNTGSTVVVDDTINQNFTWTFTDPDPQDTQSAFDFGLTDITAGTAETVTHVASSVSTYTIAAGGLTDGHTYKWRVRTYDADGLVGPWTSQITFVAHDPPPAPTVTFPTAGYTVTSHSVGITASDTATDQQQWEARVVADNTGSPDPSTIYSDQTSLTSSGLEASFPAESNGLTVHVQVRVLARNLWSPWTSVTVDVDFVDPPHPAGSLAVHDDTGSIDITWTTAAPVGDQPAVDHVDIYLSTDGGTTSTRIATDLSDSDTWTFWTPASGVDYSFQVVAIGADGTPGADSWLT